MAKKKDWGFGTRLGVLPLSISYFNIVKIAGREFASSDDLVVFAPSTKKAKGWIRTNQAYLGIRTKYLNRGFAVKASHAHEITRKIKREGLTAFSSIHTAFSQEENADGKE